MPGAPFRYKTVNRGRGTAGFAQQAGVGHLIVSHVDPFPLDPAIAELKTTYSGPLRVGADLKFTAVKRSALC